MIRGDDAVETVACCILNGQFYESLVTVVISSPPEWRKGANYPYIYLRQEGRVFSLSPRPKRILNASTGPWISYGAKCRRRNRFRVPCTFKGAFLRNWVERAGWFTFNPSTTWESKIAIWFPIFQKQFNKFHRFFSRTVVRIKSTCNYIYISINYNINYFVKNNYFLENISNANIIFFSFLIFNRKKKKEGGKIFFIKSFYYSILWKKLRDKSKSQAAAILRKINWTL